VRTLFAIYLCLIVAGLGLYITVGIADL